jgi:pectate lyase
MRTLPCLLAVVSVAAPSFAQLPAFPGAEGFGAVATGGRGGPVRIVTNLNASGPGSLQAALDQPGPRMVVFRVSGVINGDVEIPHGDVTIAGQTAPGAGITILGHLYTPYDEDDPTSNIIIRHLRVRPPDPNGSWPPSQHDSIQFSTTHTVILDHVDASHGADEIMDFWGGAHTITLQWSMLSYPIYDAGQGWDHNKGILNHRACIDGDACADSGLLGGRISVHHNVFAHARNRTPALSTGPADIVGNVVYNGREGFVHHNIAGGSGSTIATVGDFNLIGNWYIDGPSIALAPFWFDPENSSTPIPTRYFVWDNYVEDPGDFIGRVDNPYTTPGFGTEYSFACCGIVSSQFTAIVPYDFSATPGYRPITTEAATAVYPKVLARAGAWPRDIVSRWTIEDIEGRTGSWGNRRPADYLEGLTPGSAPADIDNDGMADAWEASRGLSAANPNDHSTIMSSGYTAIEEYINELADRLVALFADGFETADTSAWSTTVP